MTRKEIKINNQPISYLEFESQKEKLRGCFLILHGWGSKSERWEEIGNLLSNLGFRIIIPDLPGFGESSNLATPWSLDNFVDLIDKFTEFLKIDKFYLLGHSFGGSLAIKSSLRFPYKIEKMFLVASSGIRKKTLKKKILFFSSKIFKIFSFLPFYQFFRKAFYKFIIRKTDYVNIKDSVVKETFLKITKEDLTGLLEFINLPTIIIWGNKDDFTPVKDAYLMNKKIANSKLILIEGADHYLYRKMPESLVTNIKHNI
ncbi:MAG: alpha/beta hydrolase [bacterium]|nr:alpha/beta hydrolase [bacterium]